MTTHTRPPVVMVFAGVDPTNGAGTGADMEAIRAAGGWALTVPTALTVQDTSNVARVEPVSADYIRAAAQCAMADITPDAFKIGLVSSIESMEAIAALIAEYPSIPVAIDPVLKAGGGAELSSAELMAAFRSLLLPLATIITPNRLELSRLVPEESTDNDRARSLYDRGCSVLLTGTDPLDGEHVSEVVEHSLYRSDHAPVRWQWPRLSWHYHGSGCTLTSRLALELAQGTPIERACELAQSSAWLALNSAYEIGKGQLMPHRLYPD